MISVIVPIYNVEKYLEQCLDSICSQTYTNLEIILVDDGSTDGCSEICDRYCKKDKRITVIHKRNGGLVSARKAGMKRATGEYIAYVDGDDWIEPDMYENLYKKLLQENADVVISGRYEDTGSVQKKVFNGIDEGKYEKEALRKYVYPRMIVNKEFFEWGIFPGVWDKLFKKECIEDFQLQVDERITMGEDAACVYPCLLNAESIYVMRECYYHYRQGIGTMVKRIDNSEEERERYRILYKTVMEQFYKCIGIYDMCKQWKEYILFLMVARSTHLYKGFSKLEYLYPFSQVKKGSSIILYGAGTYGQRLHQYLKESRFCKIEAWVDRNYEALNELGLEVEAPDIIEKARYDYIVVAITYAKARSGVYKSLSQRINAEKIALIDESLIQANESLEAFGLLL